MRRVPGVRGQGLVEYGLILALTVVFTIIILGVFGGTLADVLGRDRRGHRRGHWRDLTEAGPARTRTERERGVRATDARPGSPGTFGTIVLVLSRSGSSI